MSREYIAVLLAAVICVLMSTEASGQPTVDDDGICDRGSLTSEHVANLIRKGMEKVIASNKQQAACTPTSAEPLKQALVSALECEFRCSIFCTRYKTLLLRWSWAQIASVFHCVTFRLLYILVALQASVHACLNEYCKLGLISFNIGLHVLMVCYSYFTYAWPVLCFCFLCFELVLVWPKCSSTFS